jgi:hypothetical protein
LGLIFDLILAVGAESTGVVSGEGWSTLLFLPDGIQAPGSSALATASSGVGRAAGADLVQARALDLRSAARSGLSSAPPA